MCNHIVSETLYSSLIGATINYHKLSTPSGRPLFVVGAIRESRKLSTPSGSPICFLGHFVFGAPQFHAPGTYFMLHHYGVVS